MLQYTNSPNYRGEACSRSFFAFLLVSPLHTGLSGSASLDMRAECPSLRVSRRNTSDSTLSTEDFQLVMLVDSVFSSSLEHHLVVFHCFLKRGIAA